MSSVHRQAGGPDTAIEMLRRELAQRDAEHYPVQRATACFHLGSALITADQPDEAVEVLAEAARLFPDDGMPVEHAKAMNMLGVALRDRGDPADASIAFARAAELFGEQDHAVERAAARHNEGLVGRDLGDHAAAADAFREALETFAAVDAREAAGSSARELGATLLDLGRLDEAADVLERAIDFARRGGGREALGAAANTLGIVHLRSGDDEQARRCFEDAVGAHPATVRPAAHAMARANLALACERLGAVDAARLAARQVLAFDEAAPDVRSQARAVLDRLGDDPAALVRSLDELPRERWGPTIREEARRLGRVDDEELDRHVDVWIAGVTARPDHAVDLSEAWFGVVLELPPDEFRRHLDALTRRVHALDEPAAEAFRDDAGRAMAHFPVPQWMRLRDTLAAIDRDQGREPAWR